MGSWEREQEYLAKLMEECLNETDEEESVDFDDEEEEGEEDILETRDTDTDTEQDISDTEVNYDSENRGPTFIGKNNTTVWFKHPLPRRGRTRAENLVKQLPGVKLRAKHLKCEAEIWNYFFPDTTLNMIVECTNKRIQANRANYQRERDAKDTDRIEIKAFIGLLYLAGVLKSNRLNVDEMWSKQATGVELFGLTMSKTRFRFLLQNLRFDDATTRADRQKYDKLAPIRAVFDDFVNNCQSAYSPFHYVTIDEKLEAFRGRCGFRQYIPNKPAKYGIKLHWRMQKHFMYLIWKCTLVGNLTALLP